MKYWVLFVLIILTAGCGLATTDTPTAVEPPTDTPVAISEAPPTEYPTATSLPAESPTETPLPAPTESNAQETTSDAINPTATATAASSPPAPAPVSVSQASGIAGFKDNLGTADQLAINLTNLAAPSDGQTYHAQLIGDDGSTTDAGPLALGADGSATLVWNSPGSENLLDRTAQVQIVLQPAGTLALSGGWQGDARANARQIFVVNDGPTGTPRNIAFAPGLKSQTDVSAQHVRNAANAAAIGALPETRAHLEHVINIIDGANGPMFGDYNDNGAAENPGDGFGVLDYAGQISQLLPAVSNEATIVQMQAVAMQNKALEIMSTDDIAAVTAGLNELTVMADEFKAGSVAWLYNAAQNALQIELVAGE